MVVRAVFFKTSQIVKDTAATKNVFFWDHELFVRRGPISYPEDFSKWLMDDLLQRPARLSDKKKWEVSYRT